MTLLRHVTAWAAMAAALMLASPSIAEPGPTVESLAGVAMGRAEGGVNVFRGLPYAQPPLGAARWTPPAALPRWSGGQSQRRCCSTSMATTLAVLRRSISNAR